MSGKTFKIVGNDMSDGYHTFDELYEHRCLIYINLCLFADKSATWKHHYEGWFCLYLDIKDVGQMSYHIPEKYLYLVKDKIKQNQEHVYDGHTSPDVINRLVKCAEGIWT